MGEFDLRIGPEGLVADPAGDLDTVEGLGLYVQDLQNALAVPLGSHPADPTYGAPLGLVVGLPPGPMAQAGALAVARYVLENHPWTLRVVNAVAQYDREAGGYRVNTLVEVEGYALQNIALLVGIGGGSAA